MSDECMSDVFKKNLNTPKQLKKEAGWSLLLLGMRKNYSLLPAKT